MRRVVACFFLLLLVSGMVLVSFESRSVKADDYSSMLVETSTDKIIYDISDPVVITITAINVGDQPVDISMWAGAFDFIVYNGSGNLYQWSYGQVFPFIMWDVILDPGQKLTDVLTWQQTCNLGVRSGNVSAGPYYIVGLLNNVQSFQPALIGISGEASHTSLSVSITPLYAIMQSGQSQIFSAIVTGGSPPYTYQWYSSSLVSYALNGPVAIPGATGQTLNYTAPPYEAINGSVDFILINAQVIDSNGDYATLNSGAIVSEPAFGSQVYFSVEPTPVAPLANENLSPNGLEVPSTPSAVGDNFTVEIHLVNATAENVPAGVAAIQLNFYFGNLLDYCKPIGFEDDLAQPGGALASPVISAVSPGFYSDNGTPINNPPYINATQYEVAAATTSQDLWNSNDAIVAKITFQITKQPSQNLNQTDFAAQLQIGFADLNDYSANEIPFSIAQGTLTIHRTLSQIGDLNGDNRVGLDDLVILAKAYGSKPGDPNWNPQADIAPTYGIINLADLVTLAMHYGQHSP